MAMTSIERRNILPGKLHVRASASGTGKTLVGKVAYNSRSEDLGFFEVLLPGCFTESLKNVECLCYWSHDSSQILGRQSNGTLRLKDASSALKFECDLDPNTTWGANAIAALKRDDVKSNSFGFSVPPDGSGDDWEVLKDGTILRTIKRATLYEVSPVSVPAYSANEATLRDVHMPDHIRERILAKRDEDGIADCDCNCDACDADDCDNCSMEDCDAQRCLSCPMQYTDDADDSRALLSSIITRKLSLI